MSPTDGHQRLDQFRRLLRFLGDSLKEVRQYPGLTAKRSRERVSFYSAAVA
jgi:hypothetical protein